jgi:hypothetical protein
MLTSPTGCHFLVAWDTLPTTGDSLQSECRLLSPPALATIFGAHAIGAIASGRLRADYPSLALRGELLAMAGDRFGGSELLLLSVFGLQHLCGCPLCTVLFRHSPT